MRSMYWQLGILGTISAFAFRHKETKKNLCRGGRSHSLETFRTIEACEYYVPNNCCIN